MSGAAIATLALGVVAMCAAALNGWVFALRPSERRQLWLAVAAVGVALCSAPTAALYGSSSAEEARLFRRLLLVGLFVHSLGFIRFTEHLLEVNLRGTLRLGLGSLAGLGVLSFVPGLTFSGRAIVRPLLGGHFVDAEATPFGALLLVVFVGIVAKLFLAYWRHHERTATGLRGVPGAALLWTACMLADLATGAGLVDWPSLIPLGSLGFVLAFTLLLLQRFVDAMAGTEARALLLERLVDQRAQMLREKELQLAQGERWAAAGTLAAGLAHEINNPIAFVLSNLNHLQALRKEEGSESEIEEVLLETQEGIARLRGIVDELLRLARTGERVSEPVQLARVVESVLPIVRHEARGRVRIETQLAYAPLVNGDAGRLGQAVLNLIQNAIHALTGSEREGTVRVSVTARGESVVLVVEDDGPGIPDHVLPRIFEPFFTTRRQGDGTGLGLSVTGEIVNRHGGSIDVETSGRGTRFIVTLPSAGTLA